MWGRSKSSGKSANGRFDTLISEKSEFRGDIDFSGGLHIDGKVVGTIRAPQETDAIVRISDRGVVEGDVIAPHVVINGRIKGNVHSSKRVELAAKALVQGNVYYNLLEMAMGACVNGGLVPSNQEVPANSQAEAKSRSEAKPAATHPSGKPAAPVSGASTAPVKNATASGAPAAASRGAVSGEASTGDGGSAVVPGKG